MRRAIPYPCWGPRVASDCSTIVSSVPCSKSRRGSEWRSCGIATDGSTVPVAAPQKRDETERLLLEEEHVAQRVARRLQHPRCKGRRVGLEPHNPEHAQGSALDLELIVGQQLPVRADL